MNARTLTVAVALVLAPATLSCGARQRTDGGTGLLAVNSIAPDFTAPDQDGHPRSLAEFRGHPVVLYFYPQDGTPGCTHEACAFRDAWQRLESTGAHVVGVSTDSVASHARFAREHHLPFPLLADHDQRVLRAYGVGHFLGWASRVTYVIGSDGRITHVFPDVDPAIHAEQVMQALTPPASPSGA